MSTTLQRTRNAMSSNDIAKLILGMTKRGNDKTLTLLAAVNIKREVAHATDREDKQTTADWSAFADTVLLTSHQYYVMRRHHIIIHTYRNVSHVCVFKFRLNELTA